MQSSRSGAGGKIVANRRKQRLAATPYDRPPPQRVSPPPPKSPNWLTGVIVPSARAIVSGAGKIISSIFSESESSSSEDEDSASEDGLDNDNQYDNLYDGISELDKESQETMQHAQTKKLIEELIVWETFSREECDNLIQVLNSRVIGCSMEGEKNLLVGSPGKIDREDADIFNLAVQEAKKWFHEKKVGSNSVTEFTHGNSKLRSNGLEQVDDGGGSPVDVAKSYMKERPLWASPTRNFELITPLTSTMKLCNEGTLFSAGSDSLSSSKKRNSLASGSWNIQKELRRVRSKATDDILRTPLSKINPSLFAVPQHKDESVGTGKLVFASGAQLTEPESSRKTMAINKLVDARVSHDPALEALGSRQDGKASEALPSMPNTFVHGNTEDPIAIREDGECAAASKSLEALSPNHSEEHHTDSHLNNTNGPPTADSTESGAKQTANGLSQSQASVPAGAVTSGLHAEQNDEHPNVENHDEDTTDEKNSVYTDLGEESLLRGIPIVDGDEKNSVDTDEVESCEHLSEIPIVTETDSIATGSQKSFGIEHEGLPPDPTQPSQKRKANSPVTRKQPVRKLGRNNQKKQRLKEK